MRTLTTPGVFIEEIASFPPSIAPVATAVPAFVGHTQKAEELNGDTLRNVPRRITSMLEYERLYGRPLPAAVSVTVQKRVSGAGAIIGINVGFTTPPPAVPSGMLFYAMQHYFANGGGPCYIMSVGSDADAIAEPAFSAAMGTLQSADEVTLLVFPQATELSDVNHGTVVVNALNSCVATQDRHTIADVRAAFGTPADPFALATNFRNNVGANSEDVLKYGCAYYPYLRTSLPRITDDTSITIAGASQLITVADDGTETPTSLFDTDADATTDDNVTLDNALVQGTDTTPGDKAVLNAVKSFLSEDFVTLPPSAAVAGAIARQDRLRGVHYAPANIGVFNTIEPALPITNDLNGRLNVDATGGKSINVIRSFTGKGTLIWGARTLAGNSLDNRYLNVRRFLTFAEESIEKAVGQFVFAPNDANTHVRVRTMIENFLTNQWRAGALVGPKPEQAFQVQVGLNQTMTAQDILDGLMIVRVMLAISRPAEFIVLQFEQIQQTA